MICSSCECEMIYHEGEDKVDGDTLMPYAYWYCSSCNIKIWDWDDEFESSSAPSSAPKGIWL